MNFDPQAWGWPQWTMMVMALLSLALSAAEHGKPRTGEYNGFVAIVAFGLGVFILTCGGFYGAHP